MQSCSDALPLLQYGSAPLILRRNSAHGRLSLSIQTGSSAQQSGSHPLQKHYYVAPILEFKLGHFCPSVVEETRLFFASRFLACSSSVPVYTRKKLIQEMFFKEQIRSSCSVGS